MSKNTVPTLPYAVYLVIWTATFVAIALVFIVWFVPAAPLEILSAIAIMFVFFASIITGSDTVYRLLSGKSRSKSAQNAQSDTPTSQPPKILPPN